MNCEHGVERRRSQLSGAWAGGIGTCRCCESLFGHLSSGWSTVDKDGVIHHGGRYQDTDLCPRCGGKVRER